MSELSDIQKRLHEARGAQKQLKAQRKSLKKELIQVRKSIRHHEQAREILKEVGIQTQQQLQYHISDITTLALEAVFPDPYELKVQFEERRNTTECDILFVKDGMELDPLESSGYGPVDVASFALRVASWALQTPKSINTIILDEPFKYVSKDYQEAASSMLKELSNRLSIQFIIITHEDTLSQYADKVFNTSLKNGVTKVT